MGGGFAAGWLVGGGRRRKLRWWGVHVGGWGWGWFVWRLVLSCAFFIRVSCGHGRLGGEGRGIGDVVGERRLVDVCYLWSTNRLFERETHHTQKELVEFIK